MKKALTCFVFLLLSQNLWAQDEANTPMKASYAYFGFDPDIVTNYVTPTTEELGYVPGNYGINDYGQKVSGRSDTS